MPKYKEVDKKKKDKSPNIHRSRSRSAVNTLKCILTQDTNELISAQKLELQANKKTINEQKKLCNKT